MRFKREVYSCHTNWLPCSWWHRWWVDCWTSAILGMFIKNNRITTRDVENFKKRSHGMVQGLLMTHVKLTSILWTLTLLALVSPVPALLSETKDAVPKNDKESTQYIKTVMLTTCRSCSGLWDQIAKSKYSEISTKLDLYVLKQKFFKTFNIPSSFWIFNFIYPKWSPNGKKNCKWTDSGCLLMVSSTYVYDLDLHYPQWTVNI